MTKRIIIIPSYRYTECNELQYFSEHDDFIYCTDIESMYVGNCYSDEWRLFINSSKRRLKCVEIVCFNPKSSVKAKETYESVKHDLQLTLYQQFKCNFALYMGSN